MLEQPTTDDDMLTYDFYSGDESSLNINCNMVSMLPLEYDQVAEVEEAEEVDEVEMARHVPVCYYVMNNGRVKEQNALFERPDEGMRSHLKPLFIRGKSENTGVNKILVDGGTTINLMPHFILKRIIKFDTELRPHNTVLSNYEGKIGHTLGVIQVDLTVESVTRPTLFMVITSKANYNLLLAREWIHDISVVPSSLHRRILIWREDEILENIEADQN